MNDVDKKMTKAFPTGFEKIGDSPQVHDGKLCTLVRGIRRQRYRGDKFFLRGKEIRMRYLSETIMRVVCEQEV